MTDAETSPPALVRRELMLAQIHDQGFARVGQLSRQFSISEVTVRADLDLLAETHAVQRVHGGAVAGTREPEHPFEQSLLTGQDQKKRIGAAAADLVESGQAIILDVGTTTTAIAGALLARHDLHDVIVITNALNIALLLEPAIPRFTVIVTGGTLRPLQHSLVDPLAGVVLDRVRADLAFIGCSGVDAVSGITNVNLPEADVKRRMLAAAARTVVVADSSKLGVTQLSRVAPIGDIHSLVTANEADPGQLASLEAAGLAVILA
jgi:DeoR family transcriptional regulator of aga operon